ncbi:GvpL/GvpF family gas vesicle protein [Phormidium sp. CLA17]|uniref:GvpL/GvpF family gas vesicle protein n=1 Tax=Leptolyngbya sp. Cla-17 TaxID=2803751 RepID=UPI0014915586|nr:GvpL/GvpF family gas vesicle protein [Leptolyngbya sp. Cla-17]MBM0740127.1 GvpL/GvpF family gas vesicle protein [Leptolyngbya sp. Cla-17]
MHSYAIVNAEIDLTLPEGTLETLQLIGNGALSIVVEPNLKLEVLQQDDTLLLQAILAHDRIIRALFLQTTVLPLRFSAFLPEKELIADLNTNQSRYLAYLKYFNGKAEYRLKLVPLEILDTPISPSLKGKNYFLARKQQIQTQQDQHQLQLTQFEQLLEIINQFWPAILSTETATTEKILFLLAKQTEEEVIQNMIKIWQEHYTLYQFSVETALPPYHFIESFISTKKVDS